MQSGSSRHHLYFDKSWSNEDFHSLRDPQGWKGKQPSHPEGGLIDLSTVEGSLRILTMDEAEAQIHDLLAQERAKKRRQPNKLARMLAMRARSRGRSPND